MMIYGQQYDSMANRACTLYLGADHGLRLSVRAGAGGGVGTHDAAVLCVVAAVLEGRVVMVTAEQEGPVVGQAGTVEAKVGATPRVGVGLAHTDLTREC